ncbi:hypothetical protein [Mesorhizobium sp. B2-7-2]|uniref:hypothetical protein n=1 Tax=Mesorhizobium sp. B2-7-2 TaxID=2589908 RepID=UPI00112650F8|nr:hypothetical protein [Mesorhizobium sp. B2-7-2]TPJ28022.1 hypothetical protein FJ425_13350 [Mesorhizobium sp. B2-7-2]
MAITIKQTEAAAYGRAITTGLSAQARALNCDMIWARIEGYTSYRWSTRAVTWIVEGPGEWRPPLAPATITTVELWQGDAWTAVTLDPSPTGGYTLPGCGPYRFAGTVGDNNSALPPAVIRAFQLLAEYMASNPGRPGASSERTEIPDVMTEEVSRAPSWMARAMQNSGAGDLLRPYRRA